MEETTRRSGWGWSEFLTNGSGPDGDVAAFGANPPHEDRLAVLDEDHDG
jgi:hypothetical protein